mmetsp:Transcript_11978/g.35054  ORF Transcript_11978/g.35054 Transcript_11978/m.35054 type:complete len:201 (+) Transcript_11978:1042-1644(+)
MSWSSRALLHTPVSAGLRFFDDAVRFCAEEGLAAASDIEEAALPESPIFLSFESPIPRMAEASKDALLEASKKSSRVTELLPPLLRDSDCLVGAGGNGDCDCDWADFNIKGCTSKASFILPFRNPKSFCRNSVCPAEGCFWEVDKDAPLPCIPPRLVPPVIPLKRGRIMLPMRSSSSLVLIAPMLLFAICGVGAPRNRRV